MAEPAIAPKKGGSSTFVMIAAFLFVVLIMFDPTLRQGTGDAVGFLFNPVAGLWGFDLMWTLLFASCVMIAATTAIRHFLVDWVHMARAQEIMRTFQKEFRAAQKSNNTYQLKKLTDAQPKIMQMQAEMSTNQLKPMAFTMLLVIPIFAWLSTFTAAPVMYAAALEGAPDPALVLAVNQDADAVAIAHADGPALSLLVAEDVYAYRLPGAKAQGALDLAHPKTGDVARFDLAATGAELNWSRHRVGTLPPGTYAVTPRGDAVDFTVPGDVKDHHTLTHVLVAVPDAGGLHDATVALVTGNGGALTVAVNSTVYALIPLSPGTGATGGFSDEIVPEGAKDPLAHWNVTVADHLLPGGPSNGAYSKLVPHSVRLPWNAASDLNGAWWVLPHWILLYSLFSMPIGQVTQKALKLLEYSRVDIDADGKSPGLTPE